MSLAPKLEKIRVDPDMLLLDPNNPRLFKQEREKVPLDRVQDPGFQDNTVAQLDTADDKFRIRDLVDSIERNGYVPESGGYIFVRKLHDSDYYVVLEGNRRLVAIRKLSRERDRLQAEAPEILDTLNPIDVLELVDELPEDEIQKKISYILGTCHHGSHKDWSPFAQARGIYARYVKLFGQDESTFRYEKEKGREIASLLSIKLGEVKERLTVYRSMQQLAALPEMQLKPKGGIISRYYSLIREAVCSTKAEIKSYIPRDPDTFALEEIAIQRMINLCNFDGTEDREYKDDQGRKSAPAMKNPKQWRYLQQILADSNDEKRSNNMKLVEEDHQHPEEVWARRYAELRELTWKKWLEQAYGILKEVGIGADFDSDAAKSVISDTHQIVSALGEDSGASHA